MKVNELLKTCVNASGNIYKIEIVSIKNMAKTLYKGFYRNLPNEYKNEYVKNFGITMEKEIIVIIY